jgi:hypothetical protein
LPKSSAVPIAIGPLVAVIRLSRPTSCGAVATRPAAPVTVKSPKRSTNPVLLKTASPNRPPLRKKTE